MWVYFKSGEKACTGLNLKAISEGTGKVVKRVGVWGNPKPISGDMGKDFRFIFSMFELYIIT
jgi:hypothetical protein